MNTTPDWYGIVAAKFKALDNYTGIEGPGSVLSNSVLINVTSVNDPPVINYSETWNQTVNEDNGTWALDLTAFEYDVDPEDTGTNLTWSIGNINTSLINATLNNVTDVITFTTIPNAHGTSLLNLSLTDSHNVTTNGTLLVTVNSINDIPFINGTIGPFAVYDDTSTTIDLSGLANDDNDTGTSLLVWDVSGWNTSLWNYAGQGGGQSIFFNPIQIIGVNNITDTVTVIVKDSEGGNDTVSASITLVPVNDAPPRVNLTAPLNNSNQTIATRQVILKWQNSTDAENQTLTYYVFLGNESNQSLNGSTTSDQYTTSALLDNSTYYWYIIANDGVNNATQSETWQFNTFFDNAPVIMSYEPPANETIIIAENQSFFFNATLYDMDNDTISYNWTVDDISRLSGVTATNNESISFNYTPSFNESGARIVNLSIMDINNNTGMPQSWLVAVGNNNRAPVLASITDKSIDEDSTLLFNITASDPDLLFGDNLTYSSNSSIISTTHINNTLALANWTPTNEHIGNHTINFTVTDGELEDSQVIIITVINTNDPPVLDSIGNLTADEDARFIYDVNASDIDPGYNLTFYDNSTLFNISSSTGIINFTPSQSEIGAYDINITVEDNFNASDSEIITLTISNTNDAPTLNPIANDSVLEDSTLTFNITASDLDLAYGDNLTYRSNLSNVINIERTNNTHALVNWTPTNDYVGNNTINFTVTDNSGLSDSQLVTITVNNTNDAPILGSIGTLNAYEDTLFTYDVNAVDIDTEDNLTFYDNTTLFNITTSTGIINFTPTESDIGTHYVNITVEDNLNASYSEVITLIVSNTNDAPTLNPIANYSVLEDSTLSFNITASDPDLDYGDSLSYSSNISEVSITKINNTLASISWTPTNDYVGNNTINFTVTDSSGLSSSQQATMTVNNTNDAPTISSYYPAFADPKIGETTGLQLFSIAPVDVDIGDALTTTWYLNGSSAATGTSYNATSLSAGSYNITAVVTDGNLSASQYWGLTVSELPISNEYTGTFSLLNSSQLTNASNITIESASTGKIDFGNSTLDLSDTVDLDNYINISCGIIGIDTSNLPALNSSAHITMESLSYTQTPLIYYNSGFGVSGNTPCPSTICSNITYNSASGILTFNVANFSTYWSATNTTNREPIITSSPVTAATVGQAYSYDVDASDPDNDALTYALTASTAGMSINSTNGLITWTPSSAGSYNIAVAASDGSLTDSQSFTITASEPEIPRLVITDLDAWVDGESDKNLEDGDRIGEEARPGDDIEFKIEVENKFTDDEDLEIEDITIDVIIEDIDDGDDLEEESDEFNLDAEDSQKETFNFNVPFDVEEDDYNVRIIVEGEDENNTFHRTEWRLRLEVDKETHKIIITEAIISPGIIKCERDVGFEIEVTNIGQRDEDDVSIEITNSELDLDIKESSIELDKDPDDDNSFERRYYIDLPEDLDAKTYPITYRVYYDNKLSDTETEELIVTQCKTVTTAKKEESVVVKGAELVVKPSAYTGTGAAIAQPITAKPSVISFAGSSNTMLILGVLFMFFCIAVIGLVILVMISKRMRYRR